jgi:parallel beta-helix repeat protein
MLCSSYYDVVYGNVFRNNGCGGIWISSFYSIVNNNTLESDGIVMLYSADIDFTCIHTIENNTANGKPIRYYKNRVNLTIPEDTGQVLATNCKKITIQNLTLSDVSIGIQLLNCTHCDINRNIITKNSLHGILLANTYRRSGHPLLQDSYSNNNTISGNFIMNNWDGIMIFNACKNNSIYENDFENNTCAINITYGVDYHNYNFPKELKIKTKSTLLKELHEILMYRPVFFWFQRNDIRKNNFIDNKKHVSFIYNSFLFARWRGNYWGKSQVRPVPIVGTFGASIPWVNFDWLPASEPYEIEV